MSSVSSSLDPTIVENDYQVNSDLNRDNWNRRFNMVISYGKEILCIVAFILTTFARYTRTSLSCQQIDNHRLSCSVQNSPKASRAVTPVPFFPKGSYIEEYFGGQLTPTQTKVSLSELSFVLYYAPWSSDSVHSRSAYEQVSRRFHKEAYFSAINCWQPGTLVSSSLQMSLCNFFCSQLSISELNLISGELPT